MLHLERTALGDLSLPLSRAELMAIFAGLAEVLGVNSGEVSLRLVDDREMAELNHMFLGCLGPTNVLSFPDGTGGRLGDLALSVDTLAREVFLYNQDGYEYTVRLLAHGLLHVQGYDHGPDMDGLTDLAVQTLCMQP